MAENQKELQEIKQEEQNLKREIERVEKAEERIESEEKEILQSQKAIEKAFSARSFFVFAKNGFTNREIIFLRNIFIGRLTRHRFLTALIICFGVVLVWRGFWLLADITPILSSAFVSLLVGILIIWLIGKYTHLE